MKGIRNNGILLIFIFLLTLSLRLSLVHGGDRKPVRPSPQDKCPVCGMFVAKYPDWLCQILFKDGTNVFFDGAKDMFRYFLNLQQYNPSKKISDIDTLYVTDYYSLNLIDGYKAYYVIGSDVYGPMGREFIPFEKEPDAREFIKDHKGKAMLRFKDVTLEQVKRMDE